MMTSRTTRYLGATLTFALGVVGLALVASTTDSASAAAPPAPVTIKATMTSNKNQMIFQITNKIPEQVRR